MDLYKILGVKQEATFAEIRRAYRKKSLIYHPDKNTNDIGGVAAEKFRKLSEAYKLLSDKKTRATYDKDINAKREAKERENLRLKKFDAKRRKLKEDLEAREKAYQDSLDPTKTKEGQLKMEIERLQKEGARLLEEEQNKMRTSVRCTLESVQQVSMSDAEFLKYESSVLANLRKAERHKRLLQEKTDAKSASESKINPSLSFSTAPDIFTQAQQGTMSDAEFSKYESSVLANLRRAEERKRLLEELQTQEGT